MTERPGQGANPETDRHLFFNEQLALLANHFPPAVLEESPWFSATVIQQRWNQRQVKIENVSSVGRRIRRILELTTPQFPQGTERFLINYEGKTQRFSPLAVAITETYEGPWPRAQTGYFLTELVELTTMEPGTFNGLLRRQLGEPTFCLSDFFTTAQGPFVTLKALRDLLPLVRNQIIEKNRANGRILIEETKPLGESLDSLLLPWQRFKDVGLSWYSLARQTAHAQRLTNEELNFLITIHRYGKQAEKTLKGLELDTEGDKALRKPLQAVIRMGEEANFGFILGYILQKAIWVAGDYRGSFLPSNEDLIGEVMLAALGYLKTTEEINYADLVSRMRDAITEENVSSGRAISGRVYRNIGKMRRGMEVLNLDDIGGDNLTRISQRIGLSEQQVKTAHLAFRAQKGVSLEEMPRSRRSYLKESPIEIAVSQRLTQEKLVESFNLLSEREREVLTALIIEGKTKAQVAQELGLRSPTYILKIKEGALEKLRGILS